MTRKYSVDFERCESAGAHIFRFSFAKQTNIKSHHLLPLSSQLHWNRGNKTKKNDYNYDTTSQSDLVFSLGKYANFWFNES